jgi:hypothetical protein
LEGVYANYFGGASKKLWTVYNRSGKKLDQPLIEVAHKDKVRYVEVFHDEPVSVVRKGDRVQLQTPVDNEEVVCIVELPEMANVLVKGATAEIRLRAKADQGYTLHVACGDDLPGRRQMVPLKGGTAKVALPDPLTKKTIVKVMKDYYLVDEIVLAKGSAAR